MDGGSNSPYLFRSYEHASTKDGWQRNAGPAHNIPIWKVGRATSAAPSYFDRIKIDGCAFIDGGFGTNNPAHEAYQEVKQMHNNNVKAIGYLLSIGTGESHFNRGASGRWTNMLTMMRALPRLVTDCHNAHEILLSLEDNGSDDGLRYSRFNVQKDLDKVNLDDWKKERGKRKSTRDLIKDLTTKYLDGKVGGIPVMDELERVAKVLVHARRARAETARWEIVALGTRYRCVEKSCYSGHKYKETSVQLRRHIMKRHFPPGPNGNTANEIEQIKRLIAEGRIH